MLLLAEVKHQFSDREMRSYPPLIGQLATAIENLRLFEQTQAALAETEELYQASTDLNTAKTNEEILDTLHTYTILGQGSHNLNLALFNQMWSGNEVPEVAHIIARKSILSESIISEEYTLRAFPSVFELAIGAVVIPVYLLFDRSLPVIQPGVALINTWWPVLAMALFLFISRFTLFLGVKHLGGMQTALLGLAELLVAVCLSQWWLGEHLSFTQWIGAGLLSLNLLLVGFDRAVPEISRGSGWFAWLHPSKLGW
jgi:uncharacterized membrane protein